MNNKTNFLDKILDGAAVEWKALGEFADLKRGTTITAKTKIDGNIPVISGGQKPAYYNSEYNRDGETITVAGSGAYAGFVMYWNEPIFVSDAFSVIPYSSILNTRYVFHFLLNNQTWIHNLQKGSGVSHVYAKDLSNLTIPIPCPNNPKKSLEIQQKIVAILDTFSELTAELTARKMQYSYYREKLLTFDKNEVEWKTLKDLTSLITKGTTPKKYIDTGIAFIKTEAFDGSNINSKKLSFIDEDTHNIELKRSILKHNDILITIAGATIGKCAIVPKEILPANTNQALAIIRLKDDVNLKYIFHH